MQNMDVHTHTWTHAVCGGLLGAALVTAGCYSDWQLLLQAVIGSPEKTAVFTNRT